MRYPAYALLLAVAFALLHAPGTAADDKKPNAPAGPLAAARQRLQRGNFAEARAAFEELVKDPKTAPAAATGIAASWRAEGEYTKALTVLEDAIKAAADNPDLLAHRADLLYFLGKWDDAIKDAEAATGKQEKHFLARWVRAQILRDKGDLTTADTEVRWFVREYTAASNADKDITDPELLLIVGQAGTENARWHSLSRQFSFILNEVYKDALKTDPDCWQAEYLAGRMLLEKYNRPEAIEAFDKVLTINPKAADALVGKGLAAILKYELQDAERFADQALKINPKHPEALRLKADVLLVGGEFTAAERLLTAARLISPRDEHTLGRLAACLQLMKRSDEFAALVKEVEGFDAKPAVFYHDLASCFEDRKRYTEAESYFGKAAELRPMLPGPHAALGILAMRMGKEADAKTRLEAAFKTDPFNVRVSNSIKVLRHLEKYQTIETPHYVLRFDPKTDKVLAAFLADHLEEVHAELKKQFGYEPVDKTLIEVFSTHEMFSGRVVALPDLHTIGACTGRVVAMASPKAEGVARVFNWSRVVRHELTHVFNLAQTDFQVPHWLTEGLAVRNENTDRPPAWTVLLRDRANAGKLLDLDNITLAFVRPRGLDEWTLAYAQSQLYVEYVIKNHGIGVVGKLLDAYRSGTDTAAILKSVCGVEKADFERGYRTYVEEVAKAGSGVARKAEKPMTFAELEAAHAKDPEDADIGARLAEQWVRRGKVAEARKLVDAVLAKDKGHPLACVVKARLLSRGSENDAAKALLEEAAKVNPDDPRVLLALGKIHIEAKELDKAAALYERGRKAAPADGDWLTELARIYADLGKKDELASVLTEMVRRDADELTGRVRLARVYLDSGKPADAERVAREALFIDVQNQEARGLLLDALKAQKKDAEVERIQKRFEG
jgi:tetratricopeptide (TPR) repeat protein